MKPECTFNTIRYWYRSALNPGLITLQAELKKCLETRLNTFKCFDSEFNIRDIRVPSGMCTSGQINNIFLSNKHMTKQDMSVSHSQTHSPCTRARVKVCVVSKSPCAVSQRRKNPNNATKHGESTARVPDGTRVRFPCNKQQSLPFCQRAH